jgi:hypothetical protein
VATLTLAQEIATYLTGQTLSTALSYNPGTTGSNLFASFLPDQPDTAVAVIERGGVGTLATLTAGGALPESRFERAVFQIRMRTGNSAGDYAAGFALAESIYWTLQGLTELTLNPPDGQYFHLITAVQPPQYLGREITRERHAFSQNFNAWFENAFAAA